MTIYALYIFDRHCSCIYSREYAHKSASDQGCVNKNNDSDMAQLLFGIIYSLKNLLQKLGSDGANTLRSFSTGHYRVHFLESLSNFKFALVSDLAVDNLQACLWELYSNIFVKTVVFNALAPVEFADNKICNLSFINQSDAYLGLLAVFK